MEGYGTVDQSLHVSIQEAAASIGTEVSAGLGNLEVNVICLCKSPHWTVD
jgi:hypothetical protein